MRVKRLTAVAAVALLALTGCGSETDAGGDGGADDADTGATTEDDAGATEDEGDAETGEDVAAGGDVSLDCNAVEVIVPYSPGGGSDQQVRRLQPALEEILGLRLNINYQTGGDGSVGWNALAGADPDGCTISNVVAPNIMNLSLTAGDEVGFAAEDFEYFGWTEYSPNILGVQPGGKFETLDDFVAEAEARPGELTISGVGVNGRLLAGEIVQAIGMDVTFVPVSGGVGDIIPQIAGGHIDAAISGFSLLDGDQVEPLALSAPSDEFPDLPTFEEAGYPGVTLVTSWGFILPPETPEDVVATWNSALQQALATDSVQQAYAETGFTVLEQDVEEAQAYFDEQYEAVKNAIAAVDDVETAE